VCVSAGLLVASYLSQEAARQLLLDGGIGG
jgi:hypothetical protein